VHWAVAVCVTVNVLPAIVSVPVRLSPERFDATINVTVPVPWPGPGLSIAIQAVLLTASHAHVAPAVTVLLPEPPSDVNDRADGEIDIVQLLTAPCVTVKVVPAIVSVPMRGAPPRLAATLKPTLPEPDPLKPDVIVIHAALLLASQPQPADVDTAVLPVPPSSPNAWFIGDVL
jgi:hypothetical protein